MSGARRGPWLGCWSRALAGVLVSALTAAVAGCTVPDTTQASTAGSQGGTVTADGWGASARTTGPGHLGIDTGVAAPAGGWPDAGEGVEVGTPVHIELSGTRTGTSTLRFERATPVPAGSSAVLAYLDEQSHEWQPVETTLSPDRQTLSAEVDHFSLWSDLTATYGALASIRVGRPSCDGGATPSWVDDVITVDDSNSPLRWCAGADPKDKSLLVVKVAANRGYGFGISTARKPVWTYATAAGDSSLEQQLFVRPLAAVDRIDVPGTAGQIFLPPGEELHFGFRLDDVSSLPDGKALVTADPDLSFFVAGLVFTALTKAADARAASEAFIALLAIQSCLSSFDPGKEPDLAAVSTGLLRCLNESSPIVLKASLGVLVGTFGLSAATWGPRVEAAISSLKQVAAAQIFLSAGTVVGEYVGDQLVPEQTFRAYLDLHLAPARNDYRNRLQWVVTPDGVGPLVLGISVARGLTLGVITRQPVKECSSSVNQTDEFDAPGRTGPTANRATLYTSWTDSALDAVFVRTSAFRTASKVGVGSTVDQVRRAYGSALEDFVNPYDPREPSVWLHGTGDAFLLFFVEDGVVSSLTAGRLVDGEPYVPDGC